MRPARDPERELVGPTVFAVALLLVALILGGVIQ